MNKKLTIVILTHNRYDYLSRVLEAYSYFDFNILIADSSKEKCPNEIIEKYENVKYYYTPKKSQIQKWSYIANLVETSYILFCPDDDFLFPKTIKKAIKFLEKNKDFVCAQGVLMNIQLFRKDNSILYNISNDDKKYDEKLNKQLSVLNNSLQTRLKNFLNPYRHSIYGIHRTSNFSNIFTKIHNYGITEPYIIELAQALLTIISGKIATFNKLYYLREVIKSSGGNTCKNIPFLVENKHPQIDFLKDLLIDTLIEKNISQKKATKIINKTIFNYVDFALNYTHKQGLNIEFNKKDDFNYIYLNNYYKLEPFLKKYQEIFLKYSIDSGYTFKNNENNYNMSLAINKLLSEFKSLIEKNDQIILYGAGSLAQILIKLFPKNIYCILDKNTNSEKLFSINIYKPSQAIKNEHKPIYITVLGREEEIIDYLKNDLKIKNPIYHLKS